MFFWVQITFNYNFWNSVEKSLITKGFIHTFSRRKLQHPWKSSRQVCLLEKLVRTAIIKRICGGGIIIFGGYVVIYVVSLEINRLAVQITKFVPPFKSLSIQG